jgi:hypothetical protein
MIHPRVTVVFQPAGGASADAVPAANQQVFLDITPGKMTAARTNAAGLLVTGTGPGKPVPMDDSRTYSVVVLPTAPALPPPSASGATLRVSGGTLTVTPHISIRLTGTGSGVLACTLTIGTATSSVTSSRTGFIWSNDRTAGAVTLKSDTKMLIASGSTAPAVSITRPAGNITRGDTKRFTVTAPAGVTGVHVTRWRYVLSHTNPGSAAALTATIDRPATEDAANADSFWEGVMCASGNLSISFVAPATVRIAGGTSVAATVSVSDPATATLDVTVAPRGWTTPLAENAEGTFTRAIGTFHDLGEHSWAPANASVPITPSTISKGPNNGCRFVASVTGLGLVSSPRINADLLNATSTFATAQGTARLLAPPSLRGRVIPKQFYSTNAAGVVSITNPAGLLAHLGLTTDPGISFLPTECVSTADLLHHTREHEHTHRSGLSHKTNCKKALRALEPAVFIEAFVDAPGGAINFDDAFGNRFQEVLNAGVNHTIVDEVATKTAGALRFVAGQSIPNVNLDSGGNSRPVWNPASNSPLT